MNKKILGLQAATALGIFAVAVVPAFAQLNLGVNATAGMVDTSASVNTSMNSSASGSSSGSTMMHGQNRGDAAIDARITSLTNLDSRIQSLLHVSATEKSSLDTSIKAQLDAMSNLKAKIDSDTDKTMLKADLKSVTQNYRIFALVEPQARITAAADRALDIGASFATLSSKLQVKITAAGNAGNNIAALNASLADMNAKVANANTQANAAVSLIANLSPDNGNATVAASNKTALTSARADLKTVNADLKAARADAKSIVQALQGFNVTTNDSVKG